MEPPQNTQPAATVTDLPVTPPRAPVTQTAEPKATPNSYGTAPMSEYAEWLEVDDVSLALLEDIKDLDKGNTRIEGHLPELIYTHGFDEYSTKHIRTLLGMDTEGSDRVLRLIVFCRLYPITELVGAEFWEAFWDCFRCHLDLWRGGVRHCDISVSNLMYDKISKRGILNDFDLALLRIHRSPSGTERTGTMPFMALDLLNASAWKGHVKREYRHDAESFAWVLLWICCTYIDGDELPRRPLQCFIQRDFSATYKEKWAQLPSLNKLRPTASYSQQYFQLAAKLLKKYGTRHFTAEDTDEEPESPRDDDSKMDENAAPNDNLLKKYDARHFTAVETDVEPVPPRDSDSKMGEDSAVPNDLELVAELAAVEAEVQLWRTALANLRLHIKL